MRKYFAFFHMRLLSGLQYRTAAFAGMATQAVWGILEVMLYRAFYLTAPELLPMDMQALSNYIWMQQALFGLWNVYAWEQELFQSVQSGEIAYELVRPTDIYGMWFARGVGLRLSRCALRILPVLILGILMPAPDHFPGCVSYVFMLHWTDPVALRGLWNGVLCADLLCGRPQGHYRVCSGGV